MDEIRTLVFRHRVIYHDDGGQGKFIADSLTAADGIHADFSQDYKVMSSGLAGYEAALFYTDVGHFSETQETELLRFGAEATL